MNKTYTLEQTEYLVVLRDSVTEAGPWCDVVELQDWCRGCQSPNGDMGVLEPEPRSQHCKQALDQAQHKNKFGEFN